MKVCIKCGQRKDVEQFYVHRKMSDGRLSKCKECTKADVRANRLARISYYRQYDRERGNRQPHGYGKEFYRTNRQSVLESKKAWANENADKKRAHIAVGNALRDGRLIKQPCERCGKIEHVQAHHDDYSKPFDVMWLCTTHHGERHREINERRRSAA